MLNPVSVSKLSSTTVSNTECVKKIYPRGFLKLFPNAPMFIGTAKKTKFY